MRALADYQRHYNTLPSLVHEVEDSERVVETTRSLCTTQTIVHVNVPNAHSFHRLLAYEMGLIENVHQRSDIQQRMQQSHTCDTSSLGDLVSRSGFAII